MKRLLILRHAKAEKSDGRLPDRERPLTGHGRHDAEGVGRRLAHQDVRPDLIVSSPATRARQTAEVVATELAYPEEAIRLDERVYEAEVTDLLHVVRETSDDTGVILLVGHNPAMAELAAQLTSGAVEHMPTAALACVDVETTHWRQIEPGKGSLVFLETPRG
jgi:phosphohistidine phosphatase